MANYKHLVSAITVALASLATTAQAANVTVVAEVVAPPQAGSARLAYSKIFSDSNMTNFSPSLYTFVSAESDSAWASADLRTGSLRGYSQSLGSNRAQFVSGFQENFFFNIPGADAQTRTIGFLNIDFSATLTRGSRIFYETFMGGSRSLVTFSVGAFSHDMRSPFISSNENLAFDRISDISASASLRYNLPFQMTGTNPNIGIDSSIVSYGDGSSVIDFSNSAHMRFILPQGVTFTSTSGSSFTAAVPEPATWAMLICGFGLVGVVARRRRTHHVLA